MFKIILTILYFVETVGTKGHSYGGFMTFHLTDFLHLTVYEFLSPKFLDFSKCSKNFYIFIATLVFYRSLENSFD